jgi:hypothetical protein
MNGVILPGGGNEARERALSGEREGKDETSEGSLSGKIRRG